MLVSVCIATYKRPEQLKNLLEGLGKLTFDRIESPQLEIVIVDNDSSGSARTVCDDFREKLPFDLKYDIEPKQGVTYARNRTIENASENSDFVAIIDDDEVPDSSWLEELLVVQGRSEADIVTGPVFPRYEDKNIPEWVIRGEFFEPIFLETGSSMDVAFTNNVLIRTRILKELDEVFDNRLAVKAAEDTHLFMRLHKAGHRIVWANDAIVREAIPISRTNMNWILSRGYWGSSSHSLFERDFYPSFKVQTIRFIKGCGLIVMGAFFIFPAIFQGKHMVVKRLENIYRGVGMLSGLVGIQGKW